MAATVSPGGGGGSGDNNQNTPQWLGEGDPPEVGEELAGLADEVYVDIDYWPRSHSTIAVAKVDDTVYTTSFGDNRAAKQLENIANQRGYVYIPNTNDHAEILLYNRFHNTPGFKGIGVSHYTGPCPACRSFFIGEKYFNVFWTGQFK